MFAVKYLFFLMFLILPVSSFAADAVQVRFGKHKDYERLVFEWPGYAPDYEMEEQADGIKLKLDSSVQLDTSRIEGADSAFIREFQIQGDHQIFVFLAPHDKIRDMRFGRKIIFDVYGDPEAQEAEVSTPPDIEPAAQDEEATKEETGESAEEHHTDVQHEEEMHEESSAPEEEAMIHSAEEDHHDQNVMPPPSSTLLKHAVNEANSIEPHAFVLSSSEGAFIAAYRRFGSLWVVVNRVDLPISPYIEGTETDQFGSMTRYDVAENTATLWEFKIPDDVYVTGEGGSLYWRLILNTVYHESSISPSTPSRKDVDTSGTKLRSGKVVFPAEPFKTVVTFTDPVAGDTIKAVVVDTSELYNDQVYDFVDFEALPSPVGLVFVARNPDLVVKVEPETVSIYTEEGLALGKEGDVLKNGTHDKTSHHAPELQNRLFKFEEWKMGPKSALEENQRLLLASMREKSNSGKAQQLMTMAKLNLSHGRGAEAKGLIENARSVMPQLARSPQFQGIRGAASYELAQYDLAIQDLMNPALDVFPEINLWRSATLAHLGDWQQAIERLPQDFSYLMAYPLEIAVPLTLTLTEVALRNGDKETGEMLLASLEARHEQLSESAENGVKYLQGEILRQNGEIEEAVSVWTKLSKQEDPLYRTKAELALVALGRGNDTVSKKEAVNRLENLRYVWRGDDLEVQVLQQLGLAEIEAEKYVDGFKTLRDTVVISNNEALNDRITNMMMQTYEDLFLTDRLETVSPLDAAMLYEEFRELTPSGEKGDRLVARLAERLVDADLLGRAVKLLAYQLDYRLSGEDALNTALRMASIQLMDRRPENALNTLAKAETLLKRADITNENLKQHDLDLLKARALADSGDVSGALALLENMSPPAQDISRLSADIAWKAGRWNDAASALRDLVMAEEFGSEADFTEEDAQLLLNYAITLNLSDQRITLRNIRERHLGQMQATPKGELFEVITRPRQDALLADRDTIMGMIGETEIFSDFLDTYKTQGTQGQP